MSVRPEALAPSVLLPFGPRPPRAPCTLREKLPGAQGDAAEGKLDGERVLVDGLHVARPGMPVHFDGRLDHAPRGIVHLRRRLTEPRVGPEESPSLLF